MEEETQFLAPFGNLLGFGSKIINYPSLDFEKSLSLPLDEFDLEYENESRNKIECEKELVKEIENYDELMNQMDDEEEDPIIIKETSKLQELASSVRHSTPIYQMLERIENKVQWILSILTTYKIVILDQSWRTSEKVWIWRFNG